MLECNLQRLGTRSKTHLHFLRAVRQHLDADAAWLHRVDREGRLADKRFVSGDAALCPADLTRQFAERRNPRLGPGMLLSPLRVHERIFAVVGVARSGRKFERGTGRDLNRLTRLLAADLARREEIRLNHVLDRIREKVVAELRPRDLAYQILDGLYQLVGYGHSGALLTHDSQAGVFRVEAEKIVWAKAKSAFIGHEIATGAEMLDLLQRPSNGVLRIDPEGRPRVDRRLRPLFDYYRGRGIPEGGSILLAPLFYGRELLGLLKISAAGSARFGDYDVEVVRRFLPAAIVALRNVRDRQSLEDRAMEAEVRAGLVTVARAVAHDVNNAIGAILPLAEQMREEAREGRVDGAELEQDLDVIIDNASLCKRIFSNMLRHGMERGGDGPVDLNHIVRDMLPLLEAQCAPARVCVETELESELPTVRASNKHLERIVWNLVTNAKEALRGGDGVIRIVTERDGSHVVLAVIDDGPGIPEDLLDKVQEPFFSTRRSGTGLGLALCRSLAWQYGGRLSIRNLSGGGARVAVRLPIVEPGTTERE
ncbi:MAG: hypothetical protein GY716_10995 [bacterium]|nr:hypothetical protein [bacterium]